ncbi:MAG: methyl-accepting chemotaxis protein [Burkholderiaceae bacterium]|nr:methyl-accepting chemotaxis protein [Burkholderiaceae bacterium]
MSIATKFPTLLQRQPRAQAAGGPDTAIIEDLLSEPPPASPAAVARPIVGGPNAGAAQSQAAPAARQAPAGRPVTQIYERPPVTSLPIGPEEPAPGRAPLPVAAPRERFRIPIVGAMPFRKQMQVWLPTLLLSLLVAFFLLQLDARQATDASHWFRQLGDALMQSQRSAKAASQAIAGDPIAFGQLSDARRAMNSALATLANGDGDERPVPSNVEADLRTLTLVWSKSDHAATVILNQDLLLQSLNGMRRDVMRFEPQMLRDAQAILASRLRAGAPAREVAAAGELVALTQAMAKDVNELILAGAPDRSIEMRLRQAVIDLGELTDALLDGNERARITPVSDPEVRRTLTSLKQSVTGVAPQVSGILASIPRLHQARQAERHVFEDSEVVQVLLESIRTKLQSRDALRFWYVAGAGVFGVIALLALYGLFRAFLSESEQRAIEAERHEAAARRQEQQAKAANDQNQAAILRLMNELQEVADGDLTVQATVSEDITGAIADSVNYTIEELRSIVGRINRTADQVNEASTRAQVTATSLQAASEQQSREIRDTGEAVLRMARQINEVSTRAAESVQVARQSLGASEEGSRAVDNAIAGMNGIRDQIQDTAKRIKRLGESSQEIGEIVELISDITEQTNVLALNAAIQAASAGEAGRGFTVVAEEVQRLAERSAEATRQISALIRTIQTDTQDAVAAMERSTQGVVEGARLSDEAGRALGEIGRVSTLLAELIEDFSASTSRQASSAGNVAQSIQRILLVTEQTSEGTLHTAGSIRQLSELALELKSSVVRFKVA